MNKSLVLFGDNDNKAVTFHCCEDIADDKSTV